MYYMETTTKPRASEAGVNVYVDGECIGWVVERDTEIGPLWMAIRKDTKTRVNGGEEDQQDAISALVRKMTVG